jgi:hypothetical protein
MRKKKAIDTQNNNMYNKQKRKAMNNNETERKREITAVRIVLKYEQIFYERKK